MSTHSLRRKILIGTSLSLLVALVIPGWRHFGPAYTSGNSQLDVYLDNIERVSALAVGSGGELYFSQEIKNGGGSLHRRNAAGEVMLVSAELSKPDGAAAFAGGIAFSQEQGPKNILWSDGTQIKPLFRADSVEGLAADADNLYAIEDLKNRGRLLRYNRHSGELSVLRDKLNEGEGVAVCPNGDLYYLEKASAKLWAYNPKGDDRLVSHNFNQPGFVACDEAGLWISEDATHMARVLLVDPADGSSKVVVSQLRSAQTILPLGAGEYLIAEQGRNRILKLHYKVNG